MQRKEDREMADFVREYADFIERCLHHRGVPERDRPDLQQEALCIAARRLDQLSHPAQTRAFLGTVCRRLARDLRRRASTRTEAFGLEREPPTGPQQEDAVDARRRLRALAPVLDALPKPQRDALLHESMPKTPACGQRPVAGRANKLFYRRLYAGRARLRAALLQRGLAVLLITAATSRRVLARYGARWVMGSAVCIAGLLTLSGGARTAPWLLPSEPDGLGHGRSVMFGVSGRATSTASAAGAESEKGLATPSRSTFSVQSVPPIGARLALVRVGLSEVDVHVIGAPLDHAANAGWTVKVTDPTRIKPPVVNRPR